MKTMTDPRCGKVSRANDQDGHCTACHRTFSGENAFSAHQHLNDGSLVCDDPETTLTPAGVLKFGPRERPGTTDGVAWGLGPGWTGPKPWDPKPGEVVDLIGRLRDAVDAARTRRKSEAAS